MALALLQPLLVLGPWQVKEALPSQMTLPLLLRPATQVHAGRVCSGLSSLQHSAASSSLAAHVQQEVCLGFSTLCVVPLQDCASLCKSFMSPAIPAPALLSTLLVSLPRLGKPRHH